MNRSTATLPQRVVSAASIAVLVLGTTACDMGMQAIQDDVAEDAVRQYNIAKREGDPMQRCVQAGFVVAAYLQAENEEEYNNWKATERRDCRSAGLPH